MEFDRRSWRVAFRRVTLWLLVLIVALCTPLSAVQAGPTVAPPGPEENVAAITAASLHNAGFDNHDWYEYNTRYGNYISGDSGCWLPDDDNNVPDRIPEATRQDWRLWFLNGTDLLEPDPEQVYVHSGEAVQIRAAGDFIVQRTHVGGIYQVVYNATPCAVYRFRIYARSQSENNYPTNALKVGIERTGWHPQPPQRPAVHSWPSTIVWGVSHPEYEKYYGPLEVTAEALATTIVVYTYADAPGGRYHRILWDTASLEDVTPQLIDPANPPAFTGGINNLSTSVSGSQATVIWDTAIGTMGQVYYRMIAPSAGTWTAAPLNKNLLTRHTETITVQAGATYEYIVASRGLSGSQCATWVSEKRILGQNLPPTVTSITPNSGGNNGPVNVVIMGSNFQVSSQTTVKLTRDDMPALSLNGENISVVSANQINCTFNLTGAPLGVWNVVVTNPDTQQGKLANGFTIHLPAPAITSISPNNGYSGSNVNVTIQGNYFQGGASVKLTRAGQPDIQASGVSVVSANQINCTFNLANAVQGQWNVVVTNPDGRSGTLSNGFTIAYAPPTVTSISPAVGNNTGVLRVTINGSHFRTGATAELRRLLYSSIRATNVVVVNPSQITCDFNLRGVKEGTWVVYVINSDGQEGGFDGLTIETAPDVSIAQAVNLASKTPGASVTITLTVANIGTATASDVTVSDELPGGVVSATVVPQGLTITATGTSSYTWQVEPLTVGKSGRIVIRGRIAQGVGQNFGFVNRATIADPQDTTPDNNVALGIIGGVRVYLPVVRR